MLFSIVIAVRNEEKYIKKCLEGIFSQDTKDDFELIGGLFKRGYIGILNYSFDGMWAYNLAGSEGIMNRGSACGFLGLKVYEKKGSQSIVLGAEAFGGIDEYEEFYAYTVSVLPQARVEFYDHFDITAGAEILLYSENRYINKEEKIQYMLKVDYVIAGRPEKVSGTAETLGESPAGSTLNAFAAPAAAATADPTPVPDSGANTVTPYE